MPAWLSFKMTMNRPIGLQLSDSVYWNEQTYQSSDIWLGNQDNQDAEDDEIQMYMPVQTSPVPSRQDRLHRIWQRAVNSPRQIMKKTFCLFFSRRGSGQRFPAAPYLDFTHAALLLDSCKQRSADSTHPVPNCVTHDTRGHCPTSPKAKASSTLYYPAKISCHWTLNSFHESNYSQRQMQFQIM